MDMPTSSARLLTIGDFSRLSFLSVRMLRHYDERGIFLPFSVDASTGYRFYSHEQLRVAEHLRQLRDIGCSVNRIGELLPLFDDPEALRLALKLQRSDLQEQADAMRARIGEVDRLINHLQETAMSFNVTHKTIPAHLVAAMRDIIPSYSDEGILWERFMPALGQTGAVLAAPPVVSAAFFDEEYREADVDVEVRVQVTERFADAAGVTCREIPEQQIVSAMLVGSHDGIAAGTSAVGEWVAQNGYQLNGPMFDIYVVGPAQESDPAKWVTEMCFPVRKA